MTSRAAIRLDRRWRDRWAPVSWNRGRARAARQDSECAGRLCGHGSRHRGPRDPARGLRARVDPRAGLKGKSLGALVRGITLLPLGARDAWRVITRRRPSVVVGVGGYSSGPVVLLAALRGMPTLLMEQNVVPGLTNRLLAPVVDAAAVTYEESVRFFGNKAFVSGNPVRPEFLDRRDTPVSDDRVVAHEASPAEPVQVLVFGGSQGAHAINVAMVEAASRLSQATPRVQLTHQTGERDLEMVHDGYRRAGLECTGRAVPVRDGPRDEGRGPGRLSSGRHHPGGVGGLGEGIDSGAAADRDRRSPASQRRGAREPRRRGHGGRAGAVRRPDRVRDSRAGSRRGQTWTDWRPSEAHGAS